MGILDGQVALVTGAARGQGQADCLALAQAGAAIVALDLGRNLPYPGYSLGTQAQLQAVVDQVTALDRPALALIADVRHEDEVHNAVKTALAQFGRLDILINNAAVAGMQPFWTLNEAQWDTVLDTNLKGPWLMAKHVAPQMIRQGAGKIINIASVAGVRGQGNLAHYCASKHGLVGLTRAMAIELAPYGIHVNAILPGSVASPMLDGLAEELGATPADVQRLFAQHHLFPTVIEPHAVAEAILWLVSDGARFTTGAAIPVDAGWGAQ
ncbi:MAG: SDR family NAD(P)-dependent oxidoreductase [Oscillochloridaceae bacterium umkhey_bin13]